MFTPKRNPSKRVRALASVYFLRQPPKVERVTPATVTPIRVEAPKPAPAASDVPDNHNWRYSCACGQHSLTRVSRLPATTAAKTLCPQCQAPMTDAELTWIGSGKQPK